MKKDIEKLKFDEKGLIPAIIQDYYTGEVLMMAFMNEEAFQKTLETNNTWFYSRSRQKLWKKGETSGNVQDIVSIAYDCDSDTLLIKVKQKGVACHTGEKSCFFNMLKGDPESADAILDVLFELMVEREKDRPDNSYSTKLFNEGLGKIKAKVDEESKEVLEAAEADNKEHLVNEIADLLYHLIVLMVEKKVSLNDVKEELLRRRN